MSNYQNVSCDYLTKFNQQVIPCDETKNLIKNQNERFYCELHQTVIDEIDFLKKEKIITEYQNKVIKLINRKRIFLIDELEQLSQQFEVIPSLKLIAKDHKSLEYIKTKYKLNAINEIWNEINHK